LVKVEHAKPLPRLFGDARTPALALTEEEDLKGKENIRGGTGGRNMFGPTGGVRRLYQQC